MAFPTKQLVRLIASGYPIVYLVSWEEERVERMLRLIVEKAGSRPLKFYHWTCTEGLKNEIKTVPNTLDVNSAIDAVIQSEESGFFLFKDLQFYLSDPSTIRKLKNSYKHLRAKGKTIFLLSPSMDQLPSELEKEITILDIDLPDLKEAQAVIQSVVGKARNSKAIIENSESGIISKLTNALLGLGAVEMELALKRSLIGKSAIDMEVIDSILDEKAQMIRKSSSLELTRSNLTLDDIGGLENLKEWLEIRSKAFSGEAKGFELDKPKGILIMGVSGCGKSLCAKAISSAWGLPLLRLDLNRVYGNSNSSPEETFRVSIKTVEAVSPCILWLDEIEAGITRSDEKTGDSPASRIFGHFLTWMQEKSLPVFVAATANQIQLLPPEILRKGRFDEIFFVTLPTESERKEIFRIHLEKRNLVAEDFDIASLAKNTQGLSGAEIEQAVISGMYDALAKNRTIDDNALVVAASSTVPLSITMREEISKLERWAANRAIKASKSKESWMPPPPPPPEE